MSFLLRSIGINLSGAVGVAVASFADKIKLETEAEKASLNLIGGFVCAPSRNAQLGA